jgi:hypothetical protein
MRGNGETRPAELLFFLYLSPRAFQKTKKLIHPLSSHPLPHTQHPGFDFSGAAFSGAAPDPRTFLKDQDE